ncbi:MAG: hypothetical protein CMF42_05805 [Legionellales bacterium]|nr:hypothetical protein [Legionellales bacterium]
MMLRIFLLFCLPLSFATDFVKICKECKGKQTPECLAFEKFIIRGNDGVERNMCEHYAHLESQTPANVEQSSQPQKQPKKVKKHKRSRKYSHLYRGPSKHRVPSSNRVRPNVNFD